MPASGKFIGRSLVVDVDDRGWHGLIVKADLAGAFEPITFRPPFQPAIADERVYRQRTDIVRADDLTPSIGFAICACLSQDCIYKGRADRLRAAFTISTLSKNRRARRTRDKN